MFNQQLTPLVKILLIANVVFYVLQQVSGGLVTHYLSLYDFRSDLFMPHQLITYMFLHGSLMHLFFNMLWLFFMGPMLERFMGDKKLFILFVAAGIGGALLQMGSNYIFYPEIGPATYGASGAIAGIMIAVALLFPNTEILIYMMFPVKMKYFAMFYVGSELYSAVQNVNDGVAHWAHLGGILLGFILVKVWNQGRHNFYK